MNQEKIGFFKGLGLAWTAAVMAVVKLFQACEKGADVMLDTAKAAQNGTGVMLANSEQWRKEAEMELNASISEKEREIALRLQQAA